MTRIICVIGLVTIAIGYNDLATIAIGTLIFLAGLTERLVIAIVEKK